MAIIRWRPWSLSDFLENDLDIPTIPGLNRLGQGINLYETKDSVIAELAMPGIPEDRIDVTIDGDTVRVTGSMEENQEEKGKRRYYMSSVSSSFNYSFRLPQGIADKEPNAEMDNGILYLSFEKMQKEPPKRVAVSRRAKSSRSPASEPSKSKK